MSRLLAEPMGLAVAEMARLTDRQIDELYRRCARRINDDGTDLDPESVQEPETPEDVEAALRGLLDDLNYSPEQIEREVRRQLKGGGQGHAG